MCGRFTLAAPAELLRELFGLSAVLETLTPRYNICPTQPIAIVQTGVPPAQPRMLLQVQWGLLPRWAKDPAMGSRMINARAETVAEKPAFRSAFRSRRCLIPTTGFYEWRKLETGQKQPYLLRAPGQDILTFAGLWESWTAPTGEERLSATILTTAANSSVLPIHDRMPVIVSPSDFEAWLNPPATPADVLSHLIEVQQSLAFETRPVSRAVNSPRNDRPDLWNEVPEKSEQS